MIIVKMLCFPKTAELRERAQEWPDGTGGLPWRESVRISADTDKAKGSIAQSRISTICQEHSRWWRHGATDALNTDTKCFWTAIWDHECVAVLIHMVSHGPLQDPESWEAKATGWIQDNWANWYMTPSRVRQGKGRGQTAASGLCGEVKDAERGQCRTHHTAAHHNRPGAKTF